MQNPYLVDGSLPLAGENRSGFEGSAWLLNNLIPAARSRAFRVGWINGAFFVLEPEVLDYIDGDMVMFEHAPLRRLAADRQLMAYRHEGFWAAMDTLRDKHILQELWNSGERPWKSWDS